MIDGKIVFQGPVKELWKDLEDNTGLMKVMTERAQYFRDLRNEGKSFEVAQELTEEKFAPIIDKILYPKGRKEKKKITLKDQGDGTYASDWSPYLKIIGKGNHNLTLGAGAKHLYARLFVQAQFYFRFVKEADCIFADVEPNRELYPQGIEITEGLQEYLKNVLEDNDFEVVEK